MCRLASLGFTGARPRRLSSPHDGVPEQLRTSSSISADRNYGRANMRTTSTVGTKRPWGARGRTVAVAVGLMVTAMPAGTALATGSSTVEVQPGESIQAAVDQARSGDTIRIAAGDYREAVCIEGKGLNIVGAGVGKTTISWPEWQTVGDLPSVASTACWAAPGAADQGDDPGTLADDVSGLFFLDPDSPVSVSGLSTRNPPASGI